MTEPATLALIAIIATAFGTAGMVIKTLFKLLSENTKAQSGNAEAMKALVDETRKGNREAKQRNGHLGDQNIKITELILDHEKDVQVLVDSAVNKVVDVVQHVSKQHVIEQTVDKATVKKVKE